MRGITECHWIFFNVKHIDAGRQSLSKNDRAEMSEKRKRELQNQVDPDQTKSLGTMRQSKVLHSLIDLDLRI